MYTVNLDLSDVPTDKIGGTGSPSMRLTDELNRVPENHVLVVVNGSKAVAFMAFDGERDDSRKAYEQAIGKGAAVFYVEQHRVKTMP